MTKHINGHFIFGILLWLFNLQRFPCATIESQTILKEMREDENICPNILKVVYDSNLTLQCSSSIYPKDQIEFNLENVDILLCLALYDTVFQLCHYNKNQQPAEKLKFDAYLNTTINGSLYNMEDYCNSTKLKDMNFMYEKTKPFVDELAKGFKNPKICVTFCYGGTVGFGAKFMYKPLCKVLAQIMDLINTLKIDVHPQQLDKSKQDSQILDNQEKHSSITKTKSQSTGQQDSVKVIQEGSEKKSDSSKILQTSQKNPLDDHKPLTNLVDPIDDTPGRVLDNEDDTATLSEHTADQSNQIDRGELNTENHNEPPEQKETPNFFPLRTKDDSHFFTYISVISLFCILGFVGYHNKQKILAIVLEGRKSRNNRGRRRPSTANYRKLDCTLEEAMTSQSNANVTHVIY